MLPVAFTCPLWWVARWATRVLTSLAVVAALALGAGPATAAAAPPSPVSTVSPVSTALAAGPLASSGRHTVGQAPERSVPGGAAERSGPTWSVDSPPAPSGERSTIAAGVLPVRAAGPDLLPLGDGPSSRAPRAPPGR